LEVDGEKPREREDQYDERNAHDRADPFLDRLEKACT